MILLIDNYDSFTYNLYHQIGQFDPNITVVRNDEITIEDIVRMEPKAIVLSPGPGHPKDAGICIDIIQSLYQKIPILGVCLGHQAIGHAFGGIVTNAIRIIHGKTSKLQYKKQGLFTSFTEPIEVMRYHSLIIEPASLSEDFEVDALSEDDGEIMAIRHKHFPLFGVQFHPESIGTALGDEMIKQFIQNT